MQKTRTFKVAVQGSMVMEIEADSLDDAYDAFWDSPAYEDTPLFNTEILEIVPIEDAFIQNTDMN